MKGKRFPWGYHRLLVRSISNSNMLMNKSQPNNLDDTPELVTPPKNGMCFQSISLEKTKHFLENNTVSSSPLPICLIQARTLW